MLGDCCDPTCRAYLRDPSLKDGEGETIQLAFNFATQTYYSASFKVGNDYHSWRVRKNYSSVTVDLIVNGTVAKSATKDAGTGPKWDEKLDFTGGNPVDDEVRTYRLGSCNYVLLSCYDSCLSVPPTVMVPQIGTIVFSVYRKSDNTFLCKATSKSDGKVFIFGLEEGADKDYYVTAEKASCGFGSVYIDGLQNAHSYQAPLSCTSRPLTVTGCGFLAVPDCDVVLSFPGLPDIRTKTDADGKTTLRFNAKVGTMTVSHPSGRFNSYTQSFSNCGQLIPFDIQLNAASGYTCCWGAFGTNLGRAIPIKSTLILPDAGGSTAISVNPATCGWGLVESRPNASDVAADCGIYATGSCFNVELNKTVPYSPLPAIGVSSLPVSYGVAIRGFPTGQASQLTQTFPQFTGGGWPYNPDQPTSTNCLEPTLWRSWRCPNYSVNSFASTWESGPGEVLSVMPLAVKYTFSPGGGYGPVPAVPIFSGGWGPEGAHFTTGNPYSFTVIISEE